MEAVPSPIPNRPQSQKVESMFGKVAKNYDLANDVLSLGIHHLWRKKLVRLSGCQPGMSVLDCATGTGDLAIEFKKQVGPTGKVIGSDFCKGMLDFAPAKAARLDLQIQFEQQDVTQLSYLSETFDIVSISFGIRNVENPVKGLSEMLRVLKPGGKLLVLEFGQPPSKLFSSVYRLYSSKILPKIGGWITGERGAYEYLEKSSALFPCGAAFSELIKTAGQTSVKSVQVLPLSFGIAYIYCAVKA